MAGNTNIILSWSGFVQNLNLLNFRFNKVYAEGAGSFYVLSLEAKGSETMWIKK